MSNKPFELRPSGFIEFEHVELNALVDKPNAPVDEALDTDPLSVNFGRKKDSKPTAAERTLAGTTIDWLIAFPADARPKALCDRFPHVANRLAADWPNRARSAQSLQVLTDDARWGSTGFPAQVQGELKRMLDGYLKLQ
jgi:hypothetical protein